jgi:hypothetical protein
MELSLSKLYKKARYSEKKHGIHHGMQCRGNPMLHQSEIAAQ